MADGPHPILGYFSLRAGLERIPGGGCIGRFLRAGADGVARLDGLLGIDREQFVVAAPPDADFCRKLRRLGSEGERAERFLRAAAGQLPRDGEMQGEIVAYLLREALQALIKLGGEKPFDLKQSARRVVTTAKLSPESGGSREDLVRVIGELEQALGDPNEVRLEDAVRIISRRRPLRGDTDLLENYLNRLGEANRGVHAQIGRQDAARLYERTVEVIAALFGPLVPRLAGIDELLAIDSPTAEDTARLLSRVGDDRHLLYFFERVEGPGWLRALDEETILRPPPEGGWPAGAYLERLAGEHPDLVADWLRARAVEERTENQSYFLLRIATQLGTGVSALVADLAQGRLESPNVAILVENYLEGLPESELGEDGLRRLVIESLKATLAGDSRAGGLYLAAGILTVAARGLALDPGRWLPVFVHRLRELAEEESTLRLQTFRPLAELRVDSRSRSGLELMAAGVRDAAVGASAAGMSPEQVEPGLARLPEPLRTRIVARWLGECANLGRARDLLPGWISSEERPSPEQLELLRQVFEHRDAGFADRVREALGRPPSADEVAASIEEPLPDHLRRAHNWLVAIPEAERGNWRAADQALENRFGAASADGVLFRVGPARFAGAESPISAGELAALAPLEAARRVGVWEEPPERSFLDPSAEGLADALGEVIKGDLAAWLQVDSREIVAALVAPRPVASYLGALEKTPKEIPDGRIGEIVAAVAGVGDRAREARTTEAEDADDWAYASRLGIGLIGSLASRLPAPDFESAWEAVVAGVGERTRESGTEGDPLTRAINRPWSAALESAFALGGRDDGADPRLLDLLETCLRLPRPEGELARAIIATRLPWLRRIASEWFRANEALLLGAAAPEGLGELTFAIYLEWGRPSTELLHDQRARIFAALDGEGAEFALRHLIHGLFWELSDYAPGDVCDLLAMRPERFSEAARALALALGEDDGNPPGPPPGPALALWRAALDTDLPVTAYTGWGFFAHAEGVDQEHWLELTLRTAAISRVDLAEPDEIAERAENSAPADRVLELLGLLLAADPKAWELERIGAVGLRLLRAGFGPEAARRELRERLLERGFNEATEID
jgi:hypothetical protein